MVAATGASDSPESEDDDASSNSEEEDASSDSENDDPSSDSREGVSRTTRGGRGTTIIRLGAGLDVAGPGKT